MLCPYCSLNIHPVPAPRAGLHGGNRLWYTSDDKVQHAIDEVACPACARTFLTHSDITMILKGRHHEVVWQLFR